MPDLLELAYGAAALLLLFGLVWAFLDFAWRKAIK